MATQSSASCVADILTETSGTNVPHKHIDDEDTELLSELKTEFSADIESRSVTQDRSVHYGQGDHIDNKTSEEEMSTEDSRKQITGNIGSSIGDGHKNEPSHSQYGSRVSHSTVTRYTSDFEPLSTARTVKSVSSLRYSDEFDPTSNSKTGQSQYTAEYTEDFESMSQAVETTTGSREDVTDLSHSVTVSRPETTSKSMSTSTSVHDDQTDVTDMTQYDVDDTAYTSDLDHSEMQSGAHRTYTDSYEETGVTSRPSSRQQMDASHVRTTNRSISVEESGGSHISVSRTYSYSGGSDVKYSDDDDFMEQEEEEEEKEHEEEEEDEGDREEREAARQAEVAYVERKLQALKSDPVGRHTPLTPHPPPTPRLPGTKNMQHVEDFCSHKLSLLRKKRQQLSGTMKSGGHEGNTLCGNEAVRHEENARCVYLGLEGTQRVDAHGMSSVKVWKLRERHAMDQIKKAAETKVHIPKKCPACREKLAELAEEEFFKAKSAKLLARLMDRKLEKHMLKYSDTVGLIGELVHELPTMQQTPSEITKQLLRPLENRPSVAAETTANSHSQETCTLPTGVPLDPLEVWQAYMAPLHESGWLPANT